MNDFLLAILPLTIGAVLSYFGTRWKITQDLEAEYDRDLRTARIQVYQELWKSLQPLAKYARPGPVTCNTVNEISVDLRTWYFEQGGLYLSETARDTYFALQDGLQDVVSNPRWREHPEQPLDDDTFELLRKRGSALRTSMAADVGTRKRPIVEAG